HPLELALLIAQYLSTSDKRACVLVCKSWYANYVQAIWSTLRLSRRRCFRIHYEDAFRAVLRKHIHHIRYLHWPIIRGIYDNNPFVLEILDIVAQECKNQLLGIEAVVDSQEQMSACLALADANPRLRTLNLHVVLFSHSNFVDFRPELPRLTRKLPQLEHLSLWCGEHPLAWVPQLLDCLPKLKSLALLRDRMRIWRFFKFVQPYPRPTLSTSLPCFQSLQRLALNYVVFDEAFVMLVRRCPNLKELHICNYRLVPGKALIEQLQPSLSRLQSFTLRTWNVPPFSMLPLLQALPAQSLRELNVSITDKPELRFVSDHFSATLVHLTIYLGEYIEHEDLNLIFVRCHNLKSLIVQTFHPVKAQLVIRGEQSGTPYTQPWVCTQLELLRIPLTLDRGGAFSDDKPGYIGGIPIQPNPSGLDVYKMGGEDMSVKTRKKKVPKVGDARKDWVKTERLLMQRLGGLIRLRELDFSTECCFRGTRTNRTCLTWSLENGLVYLAGLSKLERLHRGRGRFLQELPELRWMQQHWPNLHCRSRLHWIS
ncbi:hypothetical protein DFQ27_008026, partial [Actinomortierella ambigua]